MVKTLITVVARQLLCLHVDRVMQVVLSSSVNSTAEDLLLCGVDSCGVPEASSGNFSSRPNDRLVYTLLGCYVGRPAASQHLTNVPNLYNERIYCAQVKSSRFTKWNVGLVFLRVSLPLTSLWSQNEITLFCCCFTGVGVLAMLLVSVFLDNIDQTETPEVRIQKSESFFSTFLATFRHLRDKRQVLLIPVTSYIGLELGFLNADYTKVQITIKTYESLLAHGPLNNVRHL